MQRDRTSKYSRSVRGFLPGRQRLRSSFANEHSQGARWLILSSGHGSPSPPNATAQRLVRRTLLLAAPLMGQHTLLDHLVGALYEGLRNREAEGLGGLQVDHQLELAGLLHGEVAGPGAFQDLVHVDGRAAEQVEKAGPIGHEAAGVHVLSLWVHGWQPIPVREARDPWPVRERQRILKHNDRLRALACDGGEGAVEIL